MFNFIRVYIIYYDYKILNKLILKIKNISKDNLVNFSGPISIPNKIEKFTLLRSPHADKDSRDQFQISTHKKFFDFFNVKPFFILLLRDVFFYYSLDFNFKILIN